MRRKKKNYKRQRKARKDEDVPTEVLSQDEIDQLLTAIMAGDDDPEDLKPSSGYNCRKVKIYDFKRPDKFSKVQIRTISMMHEIFARLTTTSLSAQLRSMIHIHVASVDQLTYEEFIRSIPTTTILATINFDPLKGNAVLEIDPAVTFSIIDRLAGGTGEAIKNPHELTDIELSIMEGIIVRMLGNLREAWTKVIDLRPRLGCIDTNPQFAQIVPPTDMIVLITFEATIGDVEGMINLCIPYATIEAIVNKLTNAYWFGNNISSSKDYQLNDCEGIPVKLTAEILRRNYSVREILEWKIETVILPLRQLATEHCYLRLGDRRVWRCKMLTDNKWFPKQVEIIEFEKNPLGTEGILMDTSKVNPAVMGALSSAGITISVELGSTAKSVKEILGMGEGTIVELDKLAGEPVDVKANGVLIAKGEVVVIDENFGVRITDILGSLGLDTND